MEFGVQRRHVLLAPPTEEDAEWMCEQADQEDVWQAFGYGEPGGARLVLLVVPEKGAELERPLQLRIKKTLRDEASPHHVPRLIAAVRELPVTRNGKRSERAARTLIG